MRKILLLLIPLLLLPSISSAFMENLKDVVEKGTMRMTELGEEKFASVYQSPPFVSREEAENLWQEQLAEFCEGEYEVIKQRYEQHDISADTIYATVTCIDSTDGSQEAVKSQNTPMEPEVEQQSASASESTGLVSIQPEKTKKNLAPHTVKRNSADESLPNNTEVEEAAGEETSPAPELSPEIEQYIARLDEYDPEVFRNNAQEIFYKNINNPALLDAVEKTLLSTYRLDRGKVHTDGMGWLCKILGGSGKADYIETLDKIATSGATFKLRWHAALQRDKIVKAGALQDQEQKKMEIEKKLVEVKELFDQGLITEIEYSEKKQELLGQL